MAKKEEVINLKPKAKKNKDDQFKKVKSMMNTLKRAQQTHGTM